MEEQILLQAKNISKTFPGTKALKNIDLTIRRGEIHALMGENGAGKSTLSNVIGGVFKPDEGGKIIFDGKDCVFHNALSVIYHSSCCARCEHRSELQYRKS